MLLTSKHICDHTKIIYLQGTGKYVNIGTTCRYIYANCVTIKYNDQTLKFVWLPDGLIQDIQTKER